jgi:tripartite-type tricarboxylate transporter receptor subunit TctC
VRKFGLALMAAAVTMFAMTPLARAADDFPTRPVALVVGYPPGGPPDLVARIVAPAIGDALGQPVVVQNKPGAGGILAYGDVARAPRDGYTLLLADLSMVVDPLVYAKPGYDPEKDYAWIAPLTRSYMAMFVNPSFPARTVDDFVAMAKAKPGQLRAGTSGVGSPPYLGMLAFSRAAGIDLQEVPYRGIALALQDLIADRISVAWMSFGPAAGQVKAGQLRVIGVFGNERLSALPDTPTFGERGIKTGAADNGNWFGVAAPAGTPPDIVARINAAVNKALKDPNVRQHLAAADYVHFDGGTPDDLKSLALSSAEYWRDLFARAGVKPM